MIRIVNGVKKNSFSRKAEIQLQKQGDRGDYFSNKMVQMIFLHDKWLYKGANIPLYALKLILSMPAEMIYVYNRDISMQSVYNLIHVFLWKAPHR